MDDDQISASPDLATNADENGHTRFSIDSRRPRRSGNQGLAQMLKRVSDSMELRRQIAQRLDQFGRTGRIGMIGVGHLRDPLDAAGKRLADQTLFPGGVGDSSNGASHLASACFGGLD